MGGLLALYKMKQGSADGRLLIWKVSSQIIKDKLDNDKSIKAVLIQASDTSTGIKHPTDKIAEITRERDDVILIVDAITGVGVFPLPFDELGVDVMVGGSQKAFMLPPGLAFIALSEKAWKFNESSGKNSNG